MRVEFKPSFERSIKGLDSELKQEVKKAASELIDILSADRPLYEGLGLTRLRGPYWEVRIGLKVRLLFRWQKDLVELVLAGNHDEIRRFLKIL